MIGPRITLSMTYTIVCNRMKEMKPINKCKFIREIGELKTDEY
jgi:hypothetical protein